MGRPRAFDETDVVRAAADLFTRRAYDGISVDDLVTGLGVHRNSLYQVFGSKRGLYLRALRWAVAERIRPALPAVESEPALDLLILAAADRAGEDPEVAAEVAAALAEIDAATGSSATTDALLGRRLRARATTEGDQHG
ncbi:TetR/AcrR family transcriptional regulator [Actinoplanes couchii]|uniref:HTH tetR-type domain-containing protein n=1 Tax=Actinoplanes couchii TaxID=403638 RepID=A0ABQ3XMF0_9ACTN|nr:helix-turn-helix domain-containing protein [Actinoplanes couchii]MDR6319209.1 TetR/AcrR family transcriptional repressor of nem operon [Actinoplanes couchii]GID59580.1 hypothetical protein Aco03nite_079840 [Actinoplanes couchii]